MKNMLLLCYCLLWLPTAHAEIRNGYSIELVAARYGLEFLGRELLRSDLSDVERRRIHAAMKKHTSVVASFQLTEALLAQMSLISPDIYNDLDELKDKRGRTTDIYVRFVPQESSSMVLSGASFFQASEFDDDANYSRYGGLTVAIDVWICDAALNVLAHEFGHTRYVVPNLAAYRKFYTATYSTFITPSRIGHSAADASGRLAYEYGRRYLMDRRSFRLRSGEAPEKVATIARQVRRRVKEEFEEGFNSSVASAARY
jgi:hypothetical protein